MVENSPFKFLEPYQKQDIRFFFGRDDEIESLYKLVSKARIVLLYGVMGVGKTSLVRCGLADRFDDTQWLALFIRRGKTNFLESLQDAIAQKINERPPESIDKLDEELADLFEGENDENQVLSDQENNLAPTLNNLYLQYFKPIHIIFDQFEEIFTLGDLDEQRQFFDFIAKLSQNKLNVRIILAMREEYFANLDRFESMVPRLTQNRLRVEKMSASTLLKVIHDILTEMSEEELLILPKQESRRNLLFQTIANQLTKEQTIAVEPTYLQIYLDQLYRKVYKNQEARFTLEAVKGMQDIETVLDQFLEEQIKKIDNDEDKELIWSLLTEMITDQGTKRPIPKDTFISLIEKV